MNKLKLQQLTKTSKTTIWFEGILGVNPILDILTSRIDVVV